MTVASERTNAVIHTENFLQSLLDRKKTPGVPTVVRERAALCLRHYPWRVHLQLTHNALPEYWGPVE